MLRRATKTDAPPESATAHRAGPAHILVVNDDDGACELLVRLLTRAGHELQRARNADQALGQLGVGRIDCVVLDLSTGGIGQNLKLIDTIRSSVTKSIAGVRLVLVSQQSSNRMFSWEAGIDAFIARPFHADELLTQVNEVLSRPDSDRERHRRKELDAASAEGRAGVAQPWTPADDEN
jgi:two-component system phosphate regulon response regulator OmpR